MGLENFNAIDNKASACRRGRAYEGKLCPIPAERCQISCGSICEEYFCLSPAIKRLDNPRVIHDARTCNIQVYNPIT